MKQNYKIPIIHTSSYPYRYNYKRSTASYHKTEEVTKMKLIQECSSQSIIRQDRTRAEQDVRTMMKMHKTFVEDLIAMHGAEATIEGMTLTFSKNRRPSFHDIMEDVKACEVTR